MMPKRKIFIEALEQRIMLDGAGASTFLDIVDESNKEKISTKNSKETVKFKEIRSNDSNDLPFINITRDKARKKQIVFIDTQIKDHQSLISSFDKNIKVILINANEDGFKKIQQTLDGGKDYSAIHIIGHGSAGQILFGNALLTNDNIENYKSTLKDIGETLTSNGDILFYGCNIAANEQGENLIKRISKITKADIAASDDLTGKHGDWVLEKKFGIIETKNVQVVDYDYSLGTANAYGVASVLSTTTEINDNATNFKAQSGGSNNNGQQSSGNKWIVTQEQSVKTSGSTGSFDYSVRKSSFSGSTSNNADSGPMNVYMVYLNDYVNRRSWSSRGQVTFEHEILGIWTEWENTILKSGFSKSGATYPVGGSDKVNKREFEYKNSSAPGIQGQKDWFIISSDKKTIYLGTDNGLHGDFLRIVTRASPPSAVNDTGYVNEGESLSVSNGAAAVSGTSNGSHSGDASANDLDQTRENNTVVNTGHDLNITGIRVGTSGSTGSVGSALTGTYGQLTIQANGSYSYTANDNISGLDSGETLTDVYTYTVSDGVSSDTATLTITIIGQSDNSAPTASNSTVYINENNQASSAGDRTPDDYTKVFAASDFNYSDSDSDSLSKIKITQLESSGSLLRNAGSSASPSWMNVTLNQEITAADISDGKFKFQPSANTESDVTFKFMVHDGTTYSSSAYTMTISVNAAPNVTDATVGTTVAAGNDSTGDVHDSVADSDDADSVLVVTGVAAGNESTNSSIITNNSGVGSAVAGSYGTLTIAANGTYTYSADSVNNIAFGSTATDTFTFTTRDDETNAGSEAYDIGTITFTVASSIVLVNDTDEVNEDATVTKTSSQDDVLNDDAADTSGLVVTHIKKNGGSNSAVSSGTSHLNGTSVTGTYGTLVIGANGAYTYTADQSATDALDAGDEVDDVFVYTADGATATLTITVTGVNDDPVAVNDTDAVNENATITESSGDELLVADDTDADASSSLTVTQIAVTGGSNSAVSSGTNQSNGTSITGTYGTLVVGANGAYTYTANTAAAEALDAGDTETDSFTYTVSDGTATDTATLVITVTGVNDAPVAVNDTDDVNENATITERLGSEILMADDTDADASSSLTVTQIAVTGGSNSAVSASTTFLNGTSITGTYGTLVVGADGSYTYTANTAAAEALDASDTVTDSFTYTVSDGTATDTATLVITVTGVNDAPVAVNDTDAVNAEATTTQSSGDSLLVADDTDADDSSSLTVTQIAVTGGSNSSVAGSSSYNSNFTTVNGTYGTLKVGADGTYTYTADKDAAKALGASETATDSFTYTVSDGTATDTATLVITVTGANSLTAVNDTDAVNEDATITESSGSELLVADDVDNEGDTLTVTQIAVTGGSNSAVSSGTTHSNGTSVGGTYGTLVVGANGAYTYTANQSAADALDATDTATDSFTYTVSDGTSTDTATLVITVTGINDDPVAQNDTGTVNEDGTLTVSNSGNATGITSATLDSSPFSVSSQESYPQGVAFNDDGTKMYIVGDFGNDVNEYTLSTAFDVSTASYSQNFSVLNQDTSPRGISFNNDGTKMFITGWTGQDINEYTLSTAFDVSSASFVDSFDVSATAVRPYDVKFNSDGSKMFVVGGSTVNEYTLSTGFDVSTASYSQQYDTSNETLFPYSVSFNIDGTKMFVLDYYFSSSSQNYIRQYTLSTGFDLSTTSYDGAFNSSATDTQIRGLVFNNDGTKMFIVGETDDEVNEYALISPFSLVDVSGENTGDVIDTSRIFNKDTDADADASLTVTAIRTGSSEGSGTAGTVGGTTDGTYGTLTMNSNGSYSYVADKAAADALDTGDIVTDVFNYTVSDGTASDHATLTITVIGVNDAPVAVNDTDAVNEDATITESSGSELLVADDTDADTDSAFTVTQIAVTGGSNSSVASSSTYNSNFTTVNGTYGTLKVGADGTYTYTADKAAADALDDGDTVTDSFTYTVSDGTATDTATLIITVTGINDAPVARNDTGTVNEDATLTVNNGENAQNQVYELDDTVDSETDIFTDSGEQTGSAVSFSSDGLRMFTTGVEDNKIHEWTLSAAFNPETKSGHNSLSLDWNNSNGHANGNENFSDDQGDWARGHAWKSDGTQLFVMNWDGGLSGDGTPSYRICSYDLTTPYDISTITRSGGNNYVDAPTSSNSYDTAVTDTVRSFAMSSDGKKFFFINKVTEHIHQISLTTAYDLSTASAETTFDASGAGTPKSLAFSANGKKLFVGDDTSSKIYQYDLTTAFNLSSGVSLDGSVTLKSSQKPFGIAFSNDGTKMLILDRQNDDTIDVHTLKTPYNLIEINDEHTGDVIDTNSASNQDTDADDSSSLTVTSIRTGSSEGTGTAGAIGSALTGTYGQLTIAANGSYSYTANTAAADALDAGDIVTDVFNYTVSDGTASDHATLTITVIGVNDAPVAVNDTDGVLVTATVTDATNSEGSVISDDTDADDSSSLTVTKIQHSGAGSASNVSIGTTRANGQSSTGTYGTLTIGADGTYSYVAGSNAGTDVFTYTVSDGTSTDTATLTITVSLSNNAPVAVNDTDDVNENATITESSGSELLVADDTDANSDTLTVTQIAVTGGSNSSVTASTTHSNGTSITGTYGTLVVGADGSYTYTANTAAAEALDASDTVTDSFTYTVSDGIAVDTATLIITVTGVNDTPVAVNDTDDVNENATITESSGSELLIADDTDSDASSSLTVTQIAVTGGSNSAVNSGTTHSDGTSITGTYGTLVVGANGAYTYTANTAAAEALDAGDTETDSFTYTVSDGTATATATLVITVTGVNDAPVAVNDTDAVNEDATITESSGSELLVADDTDSDASSSLTVTQIAVTGGSNSSVASGSAYNSNFTTVNGTYGTLKVGADGTYTYTADKAAADALDAGDTATDSFTYTVSDGTATDTATLIITVTGINDDPTAVDDTASVNEDATVTVSTASSGVIQDNDSDADADDATNSLVITQIKPSGGSNSSVSSGTTHSDGTSVTGTYGTLVIGADGTYSYVADQSAADALDAGDQVNDVFTYTVSDGNGGTATANITITVTGVNDAPVAVNDTDTVNEDATITESSGSELLVADDTDADADSALTVTQIAVTGGSNSSVASSSTYNSNGTSITGTYGTLVVGADGTYTYTADQSAADALDAGDTATDSFTYTVSDGTATDTATLIITVTGINDAPVAVNDTDAIDENATITESSGSELLVADDTDSDASSSLTVTQIAVTGGSNSSVTASTTYSNGTSITGTYGTLVVGADGSYTYTANTAAAEALDASDTVTDSFTYTVSDGTATDTATLVITVTGVNDAPTATDNTVTTLEDTNHVFSTSDFNFSDSDDSGSLNKIKITSLEDNGALQYYNGTAWVDVTLNQEITATDIANNKLRFVPDPNENGDSYTSFGYQVSDGTVYSSSTNTMTVNVTPVADPPVAVNDTDAVNEDATITESSGSELLVADDTDGDGDTLTVTQIAPTGGSNSSVTASTTYSNGTSITGTYGTLVVGADGSYTYVADQAAADALDAGDTATDSFTYTVSDGSATDTATLVITVTGVADDPVAVDDTATVFEDGTVTVSTASSGVIQNNDSDADEDDTTNSLVLTQIAPTGGSNSSVSSGTTHSNGTSVTGTYGTLVIGADGTYTYTADQSAADDLADGETATDSFTYTVSDGNGGTATATITITVTGTNDAPTASDKTLYINENNTDSTHGARTSTNITYTFASNGSEFNFSDVDDSDSLSKIKVITVPTYGTLTRVDNGNTITANTEISNFDNIKYTPSANNENDDSFNFKVHDGSEYSAATYTMNVSVNAAPVAVDDTDSITAGASAQSGNVVTNDTDSDDNTSDMTIIGVAAGAEGSTLANENVGSAVSGTYGTLTLNSDGSYSYDVTGNAATIALAEGATATDTFSYKVNDDETNAGSKALDIGAITFTVTGINEVVTATDDNITINTKDESITVTNGSSDAEANDVDGDGDTLTITNFALGSTEGSGTTLPAGSEIGGNYGTLLLNADGSYTYTISSTLTGDNTKHDGAAPVHDYFWYTVTDGNSTDTAVLKFTVTFPAKAGEGDTTTTTSDPAVEGADESAESDSDKGKGKQNKDVIREKKQRRSEKIDTPELELPKSNQREGGEFNQGLKLVDLVAESKSIDTGDDSAIIQKLKAKYTKDGMKVKFKVFSDEGKEMQKFYGVMKDGSSLPKWIKVDPKTGKTTTKIPKGVDKVEFKIVALDADNNQNQVTVVIDPKKLSKDKDVFKKIKKVNKAKVDVKTSGSVQLQSTDETGSIDTTTSNVLNNNKVEDFSNIEPSETLDLNPSIIDNKFILDLPPDLTLNIESLKVLQEDGQEAPEWVKVDPITGQIVAEPPKDVENIKLKIVSENENGEVIVKEVELDFNKENNNTKEIIDPETNFEPLNAQLAKQQVNFDDYGDKLIRSL